MPDHSERTTSSSAATVLREIADSIGMNAPFLADMLNAYADGDERVGLYVEQHNAWLRGADPTTVRENVYDALMRLAATHKRAVCECENCPPGKAFQYDDCECGEDWSTCSDDIALLDEYVPNWRGQAW